jgi:1-acyl-sn-glycerol-3-phosphate acyltransferase
MEPKTAARMLTLLNPRLTYHRASIDSVERIPESGAAMIVSNHGRLDFDSFLLIRLMSRARGRLARLLADHMWFRLPLVDRIFSLAGAVDGTRENALRLLERGEIVLAYPGGVREIMSGRFGREHIAWDGRIGFARVAIEAGVPVIPVVGVGVNSGFVFVSDGRLLGKLLFQGVLRLGPAYADYRNPLVLGIVPCPLPLSIAIAFPLPCRVTYFVGEPMYPPVRDDTDPRQAQRFARRVGDAMWGLIELHGRPEQAPDKGIERNATR